jgi:phycocyanin-associated rod protein
MSGMTITGSTSVSDRDARTVLVEVTGLCRQNISKTSNYHLKVPYNRLSQTIQNISRMGGKVSKVNILSAGSLVSGNNQTGNTSNNRTVNTSEVKKQPVSVRPQARNKKG